METTTYRSNIMICAGTGCVANGSLKVKDALEAELIKRNLQKEEIGRAHV